MIRSTALLLLGLATTVLAQTHDLSIQYEHEVGDRVEVYESQRNDVKVRVTQGGQVIQERDQIEGKEVRFVLEVQAVDEEGKVTHGRPGSGPKP